MANEETSGVLEEGMDQAWSLRERSWKPHENQAKGITRTLSVTSGKGGVGKTIATINLACELARQGRSVLVLDGDLSLANIDIMLGVTPKGTIWEVLSGKMELEEILIEDSSGVTFIPASSGIPQMVSLDWPQRSHLFSSLERVAERFEYLLVDTQAGIGAEVLQLSAASAEILCVVNPEPTSLTDAYALMKVLSQSYGEKRFSLIVNNVPGQDAEKEGQRIFRRLSDAVERFLHVSVKYLGSVPADESVRDAIQRQRPLTEVFPSSKAASGFRRIAERIDSQFYERRVKGGMQLFFRQLLEGTEA